MSAPAAPQELSFRESLVAGAALAAFVVCLAVGERLSAAAAIVHTARDATPPRVGAVESVQPDVPGWWLWAVAAIAGIAIAAYVARTFIAEARGLGAARTPPAGLTDEGVESWSMRERQRSVQFIVITWAAVAAWGAWQLLVLAERGGAGVSGGLLHAAAIVLGLLALGGAGRVVVGDPEEAWKRASIVRVQLVVLVALFAVVFLVPVTSAQVIDVVRAWGEGSAQSGLFTAASVAFAGALLLGAVCRASSIRLLSAVPGETHWRPTWLIFAVLAGVLVACAVLGAYLGALMAAIALAIMGVTQWAESPAAEAGWEDAQTRARRLAGTLSVVPLAIVVAALAGATVDSWLLPSRGAAADGALIALTFVAAAVLAALAAISQRPSFGWTLLRGLPWLAAPIGLAVGLVTVVVVLAVPGRFEVLATIPLLAFAAMLAFRCFAQGGGPELWGALGVVLAVVGGVYADPIALPRALGAFGIALIGTTGLLLGLHAIAVVGARRAWKAEPPLLPKRVPVGSLLAIWLVAAFLWPAIGAHQVRTVAGGAAAPLLSTTTTGWLDARLKALGGKPPYIPMLLVGASGGGARAAYWTDLVMDCVLGIEGPKKDTRECEVAPTARKRGSALFLTSSVSGGSIGVYHLVTHLAIAEAGEDWVDATAGPEVLSPVTGWGLFHDMPAFMTGLDRSPPECESDVSCRRNADRALVQEAAISGFPRGGIVPPKTQRLLAPALPVTVFNGALDGADGRILMSPLDLAPPFPPLPTCSARGKPGEPAGGSLDVHDVLDDTRLPLVTAALSSARFPVIAPAARIGTSTDSQTCLTGRISPATVRDGGYIENTGMLTLDDLLPAIESATAAWTEKNGIPVHIVVLSIDDDPAALDAGQPVVAAGGGPTGIGTRAGPAYLSRLARDRIGSCQHARVTSLRASPAPHAGAHGATGWQLSRTARVEDLGEALRAPGAARTTVDRTRKILDGGLADPACP